MEDKRSKRRAIAIFGVLFAGLILAWVMIVREVPNNAEERAIVAALIPEDPAPRTNVDNAIAAEGAPLAAAETPAAQIEADPEIVVADKDAAGKNAAAKKSDMREPLAPAGAEGEGAPIASAEAESAADADLPRAAFEISFRESLPWMEATMIEVDIDGERVAVSENAEGIGKNLGWRLTESQIPTGMHKVDVTVKLVGDSRAFPYLKNYTFTVRKSASIAVRGPTKVLLDATPKGNATDDWTQRVDLQFRLDSASRPAL